MILRQEEASCPRIPSLPQSDDFLEGERNTFIVEKQSESNLGIVGENGVIGMTHWNSYEEEVKLKMARSAKQSQRLAPLAF